MLTKTNKTKTIGEYRAHDKDTGSPEVQIALLTKKMEELAAHLAKNKKDIHSRRGLLRMVAKRKSLLNYLQKEDAKRYSDIAKKVGLKP